MDYKCDLDCPGGKPDKEPPPCCRLCYESRKRFVTEENKTLWSDTFGFWSPEGCRLSRENMPDICRDFDCRKYIWNREYFWVGQWCPARIRFIPAGEELVLVGIGERLWKKQLKDVANA